MGLAVPFITQMKQIAGEDFADAPNDGELASFRTSPGTWGNRPRALLRDGAQDLFTIEDAGSASGCMFAVVLDDGNTFNQVYRNDTFSTDVFDGLYEYITDAGFCVIEPFRNSSGVGMNALYKGGDAAGTDMDGGDCNIRPGLATGTGTDGRVLIGLATTDRIAFYGATGGGQAAKINDPSGGATVDTECRSAVNDLIDVVEGVALAASA